MYPLPLPLSISTPFSYRLCCYSVLYIAASLAFCTAFSFCSSSPLAFIAFAMSDKRSTSLIFAFFTILPQFQHFWLLLFKHASISSSSTAIWSVRSGITIVFPWTGKAASVATSVTLEFLNPLGLEFSFSVPLVLRSVELHLVVAFVGAGFLTSWPQRNVYYTLFSISTSIHSPGFFVFLEMVRLLPIGQISN